MSEIKLGQVQPYENTYNPDLLHPIARAESRQHLAVKDFIGVDLWTGYELSWLDSSGKPQVAIAQFLVPCGSEYLIESKSFKYYLNSYNQSKFASWLDVQTLMTSDLTEKAGAVVKVELFTLEQFAQKRAKAVSIGRCIDDLKIAEPTFKPGGIVLQPKEIDGETVWLSHLLKSNCPVTGQPDWASVWFGMHGVSCAPEQLLAYVISFREHQDFHEHCVERMFNDIGSQLKPSKWWVYARYTRRGGLDINPFRTSDEMAVPNVFGVRQ